MRWLVGSLLVLGACAPCEAKLNAEDSALAERASHTIEISKRDGLVIACEATSISSRKLAFAFHCLGQWDGSFLHVERDGSARSLAVESLRCATADVSEAKAPARDGSVTTAVDGVCEVELTSSSRDFESFAPRCFGQWQEGASAAVVVHRNGQRVALATCNDGRDNGGTIHASCTGTLARGDSGAGAVVGGCLAGVMLSLQTATIVSDRSYVFSELAP